jgi:hypothetical protein
MKLRTKTVWLTADGTEHATLEAAQEYERYATVRQIIEDADLDWRGGAGKNVATPDRIAKLLAHRLRIQEQADPDLLEVLKDLCAEFRSFDLPSGSKAYNAAINAINNAALKGT